MPVKEYGPLEKFNPKLLYACYMHIMQHACSMHGKYPKSMRVT
jgi:hypothetical protein